MRIHDSPIWMIPQESQLEVLHVASRLHRPHVFGYLHIGSGSNGEQSFHELLHGPFVPVSGELRVGGGLLLRFLSEACRFGGSMFITNVIRQASCRLEYFRAVLAGVRTGSLVDLPRFSCVLMRHVHAYFFLGVEFSVTRGTRKSPIDALLLVSVSHVARETGVKMVGRITDGAGEG